MKVDCNHCNHADKSHHQVKKRMRIRMQPGRYTLTLHYYNMNVEIQSNLNGALEVGEVPSPGDSRYRAKLVVLNYPSGKIKITCDEKLSVANVIQGGK